MIGSVLIQSLHLPHALITALRQMRSGRNCLVRISSRKSSGVWNFRHFSQVDMHAL